MPAMMSFILFVIAMYWLPTLIAIVRQAPSALGVAVLNFFLGWLVKVALFVPAILTLGLLFLIFPFLVNTVMLWLTDKLLRGFEIEGLGTLLLSAAIITLVTSAFHIAVHPYVYRPFMQPGPPRWI